MHYFALAQIFYRVAHIGVIHETQDVVICYAGFLLGGEVLIQVGDGIALYSDIFHIERHARCRLRVNAYGMVYEICVEARFFYFIYRESECELIYHSRNHFEMGELFRSDIGEYADYLIIRHGIALIEISH